MKTLILSCLALFNAQIAPAFAQIDSNCELVQKLKEETMQKEMDLNAIAAEFETLRAEVTIAQKNHNIKVLVFTPMLAASAFFAANSFKGVVSSLDNAEILKKYAIRATIATVVTLGTLTYTYVDYRNYGILLHDLEEKNQLLEDHKSELREKLGQIQTISKNTNCQ